MTALAWIEESRARLLKTNPLLTRQNVRSVMAKSYYSAEKFRAATGFTFIPIKESLAEALRILESVKK